MNAPASPAALFAPRLIAWQRARGRHDLPWQENHEAYRVWLSEIMLQQTQVATVIPYYRRFLEHFPTLETLAQAPIEAVLELWSGLGYYARARNLHRCAQEVASKHGGRFPTDPAALAELPGIGRSTAAAIAVFAFGARAAILDGNVKRVLTRCFGVEGFPGAPPVERQLWALAEKLLPATDVQAYTQGLMDLGASLCARRRPDCPACPMHEICLAAQQRRQHELPTARPHPALPQRAATLLLLTDGHRLLLERRPPVGIWGGLLSLPEGDAETAREFARRRGFHLLDTRPAGELNHAFTHFRLHIRVLACRVRPLASLAQEPGWPWLETRELPTAALPAPIRRLLKQAFAQDLLSGA